MDDPFIQDHDAAEVEIADPPAAESPKCTDPVEPSGGGTDPDPSPSPSLTPDPNPNSLPPEPPEESPSWSEHVERSGWGTDPDPSPSPSPSLTPDPNPTSLTPEPLEESSSWSEHVEPSGWGTDPEPSPDPNRNSPKVRMSWADIAQEEDELAEEEEKASEVKEGGKKKVELPREQREWIRFKSVVRKKDFICLERVKGKIVNILDGLELHTGVFSAVEQKRIVDFVYELQEKGRKSELGERTYSEPRKWMPGKGRVTIQFGCCYNYAMDKDGNPPGILQNVAPDPIPNLFKVIIRRLVRWHVLPTSCIPDSCIVNIYEPGDCIPPHIDSHDFVRPFSTVSFLSECNILFGTHLKVEGPGDFSGSTAIPLPLGSVLVLNGNGADVAKHCVPAVPANRISITFRKMDEAKQPIGFSPEPDLQNIHPLPEDSFTVAQHQGNSGNKQPGPESRSFKRGKKYRGRPAGSPYQSHDPETPLIVRSHQVIDARSAASGDNWMGRSRDSAGGSFESKPSSSSQDIRRLRDDGNEQPIRRSPHQEWAEEGSGHPEVGMEPNGSGRRVRLDQNRIIISRNIEVDEEAGSRSADQAQHSRGPYRPTNTGQRRIRVVVVDD